MELNKHLAANTTSSKSKTNSSNVSCNSNSYNEEDQLSIKLTDKYNLDNYDSNNIETENVNSNSKYVSTKESNNSCSNYVSNSTKDSVCLNEIYDASFNVNLNKSVDSHDNNLNKLNVIAGSNEDKSKINKRYSNTSLFHVTGKF